MCLDIAKCSLVVGVGGLVQGEGFCWLTWHCLCKLGSFHIGNLGHSALHSIVTMTTLLHKMSAVLLGHLQMGTHLGSPQSSLSCTWPCESFSRTLDLWFQFVCLGTSSSFSQFLPPLYISFCSGLSPDVSSLYRHTVTLSLALDTYLLSLCRGCESPPGVYV